MKKRAAALAILAIPSAALARDFSCRNEAAEIRCEAGECRVETGSFTPMQLTRLGSAIRLCAYSGCWEGRLSFSRSRSGVDFLQSRLRRSGSADEVDRSVLSVMFSRAERTAHMNWNGFFSLLTCGPHPSARPG
ncbi:MAG TPA: hypothetical protein VGB59_02185 [Allosphingosinicella sp.]|jgi:hypothetical protein